MQPLSSPTDARPPQSTTGTAARALSSLYLFAVAVFVIHVAAHALSSHYTVPNKDDWRIFDDMFATPVLEWIATDQNGHFVPVTLALLYVDYTVLGGHMHLLAVGSVLCFGIGLSALVFLFAPWRQLGNPLGLATLGLACFLLAWGLARHDLVWGLQGSVVLAAMWTLWSLAAFGLWLERRGDPRPSGASKLLMLSLLAASAATFSQGVGFSVWAGLIAVAAAARVPLRVLALIAACALGVLLLYRTGLDPDPGRGSLDAYRSLALSVPTYLVGRAFAFIGSPIGGTLASSGLASEVPRYALAQFCGAVGGAVFGVYGLRRAWKREKLTRRHALAIGLPATALVGGLLVALNRVGFPEAMTHIRFSTWSSLFWLGLTAAIPVQAASRRSAWVGMAATTCIVLLSALTLPALGDARSQQARRRDQLAAVSSLHQLELRWDAAAGGGTIIKSPERSYRLADRFRRDGRSFFAEPAAELPGTQLTNETTLAPPDRCSGAVTSAERIYSKATPFLRVSGWGLDRKRESRIDHLAITDADRVVVGLGVAVRRGTSFFGASLPDQDFPFTGFIRGTFAKGPFAVFALLDDGRVACRLGTVRRRSGSTAEPQGPTARGK